MKTKDKIRKECIAFLKSELFSFSQEEITKIKEFILSCQNFNFCCLKTGISSKFFKKNKEYPFKELKDYVLVYNSLADTQGTLFLKSRFNKDFQKRIDKK